MQFLQIIQWLFGLIVAVTGTTVTSRPESYRTGRLNQFAGYVTPQPLPSNAQYLYSSVWAAWSAWSICVNNYRVRVRACNTVKGFKCFGKNMEQAECESTATPTAELKNTEYDVVDPWEEDRKEALKQLYPDYVEKQTVKPVYQRIPLQQSLNFYKNQNQYRTTTYSPSLEGVVDVNHSVDFNVISSSESTHFMPSTNAPQPSAVTASSVPTTSYRNAATLLLNSTDSRHSADSDTLLNALTTPSTANAVNSAQAESGSEYSVNFINPLTKTSNAHPSNVISTKMTTKSTAKPAEPINEVPPLAEVVKFSTKKKELLVFNPVKQHKAPGMIPVIVKTTTEIPLTTAINFNRQFNFTFTSSIDSEEDLNFQATASSSTESSSKTTTSGTSNIISKDNHGTTFVQAAAKRVREQESQQNRQVPNSMQSQPSLQILQKLPKPEQQRLGRIANKNSLPSFQKSQNSEEIEDEASKTTVTVPLAEIRRLSTVTSGYNKLTTGASTPPKAKIFHMENFESLQDTVTTPATSMVTSNGTKLKSADELIRRIRTKLRSQMKKKKKGLSSQNVRKRVADSKESSEEALTTLTENRSNNTRIQAKENYDKNQKVTAVIRGTAQFIETDQSQKTSAVIPFLVDIKPGNVKQFSYRTTTGTVRKKPEMKSVLQKVPNNLDQETTTAKKQNNKIQNGIKSQLNGLDEEQLKKTKYIKVPSLTINKNRNNPSRLNSSLSTDKAMNLSLVPLGVEVTTERPPITQSYIFPEIGIGRTTINLKDGVWSEWNEWGNCLCGTRIRTRNCEYEPFLTNGCRGSSYESAPCHNYSSCNFVPYRL
uniref:Mucin-5AC n=1 Tax=Syphacia muris TaxID=451379 RepID=A0A0N5AUC5_9BILA